VLVTGLGVVSPIGVGAAEFWAAQVGMHCGIRTITRFETAGHPVRIAGEVDLAERPEGDEEPRQDRFTRLAEEAARQAVADSGLNLADEDLCRVAVVLGTGVGGVATFESNHQAMLSGGVDAVRGRFIPMYMMNAAAASIALRYGFRGPCSTVSTACASGADALVAAHQLITSGRADVVFAGGVDAPIVPSIVAGFARLGVLSTRNDAPGAASRPFDSARDGFVIAEGAAVLALESASHVAARGGRRYASLAGYGQSCDAHDMLRPHPDCTGAIASIEAALHGAGLDRSDVDYINAHGTSTLINDVHEARTLRRVLAEHTDRVLVSATKSLTGHMLGAAGAAEAVATIQALAHGIVPPTANLDSLDPKIDLAVPTEPIEARLRVGLSNSFGFGGHNTVLAFTRRSDFERV
jgi:3-oxoacyl-[acyl-carrier-protein] synthase II